MTSDSINDFLFIHYKHKDVIINRKQFSRSVSFNSLQTLEFENKYLLDVIEYGQEKILNFDLDRYLTQTFKVEMESPTKLCIIANLDQLQDSTAEVIKPLLFNCPEEIEKNAISFSISSRSEIKKYDLDEFKELSKVYNEPFKKKGILSCFFNGDRIQYFIDIDKILYNSVTETGE